MQEEFGNAVRGKVLYQEPLSRHTTFKIGGPADIFFQPADEQDLIKAQKTALALKLPVFIFGAGSNLLVLDGGIRGLVINLSSLKNIVFSESGVRAQAGIPLPSLVAECCRRGLKGLEFAGGIPGSLAGGIWMNAGAHGFSLGDFVRGVTLLDYAGNKKTVPSGKINFSYRSSSLQKEMQIILDAELELQPGGSPPELLQKVKEYRLERSKKQPSQPSAGSVFLNPPGFSAGYLIESVNAKGLQFGGAQVSRKHSNFIVNNGEATAKDVITLMTEIQRRVMDEHGVNLQPEIRIVGEDDNKG